MYFKGEFTGCARDRMKWLGIEEEGIVHRRVKGLGSLTHIGGKPADFCYITGQRNIREFIDCETDNKEGDEKSKWKHKTSRKKLIFWKEGISLVSREVKGKCSGS